MEITNVPNHQPVKIIQCLRHHEQLFLDYLFIILRWNDWNALFIQRQFLGDSDDMSGCFTEKRGSKSTKIQCGAPKIAKLVYNSNNYGLWYL